MRKLLPVLVLLIGTALTPRHGSAAADLRFTSESSGAQRAIVLVGAMGGETSGGMVGGGGGMSGMTGGGMGDMTAGGMTGRMGGVFGGMIPYGGAQGNSLSRALARPTQAGKLRRLNNTIGASRPTTNAHWLPRRARCAVARHAPALPAIAAGSNSVFLSDGSFGRLSQ